MEKIGYVIGSTTINKTFVANNKFPYLLNEYLIIEDELQGRIPCEVIETEIIPFVDQKVLPKGCTPRFLEKLKFDMDRPIFIAEVKLLKNIKYPIMPNSEIKVAEYDEISKYIIKAKPDDSMAIGVIKGTEFMQNQLPQEINNKSPLWENGRAVDQQGIPLLLNYHSFREYPHIGLFGSSGSGKSFAMRVVIEEMMEKGIPALVLDPHNESVFEGVMDGLDKEHHKNYSSKYQVFKIGSNVGIKFEDTTLGELETLFQFVEPLTEPQKNALEVLYEKGDSFKHLQNKINNLKEAFEKVELQSRGRGKGMDIDTILTPLQVELYSKCKNKVSGAATLQALSWKCVSLEKTGIFVGDVSLVSKAMKSGKIATIRGDIKRLQMISSYLINKLYNQRRHYVEEGGEFFPPFFTVVDEAHNFAPNEGRHIPTKSIIREIGQEARKYGVFLVMCTQRPKSLDETLLAQLNTKFIFRLTDQNDIHVAKLEGNLTDNEVIQLPDLPSGNCFVSSAILDKTYPVRFRTTFSKAPNVKDPFDELSQIEGDISADVEDYLIGLLPTDTIKLAKSLKDISMELNKVVDINELGELYEKLELKGIVEIKKSPMGIKYKLKN